MSLIVEADVEDEVDKRRGPRDNQKAVEAKDTRLFLLEVRNIRRVDGLYFLGIEDKFGKEAATQIDARCWQTVGGIEARYLTEMLDIEKIDPKPLIYVLRNTGWALDILEKEAEIAERRRSSG